MAHPCPPWVQMPKTAAIDAPAMSSTSSRTIWADLPPSSRNTFLIVGAPASMIRRPTAVEPVKLTMSTSGLVVSTSPIVLSAAVTTFRTPAGMSVCSATSRPRASAVHGRVRRGLEHHRAPGCERWRDLGDVDLVRVVPRGDRRDHTDRFTLDPTVAPSGHRVGDAELLVPLVALREVGEERQELDRLAELRTAHQHAGRAHLGHRDVGEVVLVLEQRLVQLAEAPDPQVDVAGPLGVVEGVASSGDRPLAHRPSTRQRRPR